MSIDLLEDKEVVVPIFDAFDRELPQTLERPERVLEELLSALDGQIQELEQLANKPGAEKTAERAVKLRKNFVDLEKRALKEMEKVRKALLAEK